MASPSRPSTASPQRSAAVTARLAAPMTPTSAAAHDLAALRLGGGVHTHERALNRAQRGASPASQAPTTDNKLAITLRAENEALRLKVAELSAALAAARSPRGIDWSYDASTPKLTAIADRYKARVGAQKEATCTPSGFKKLQDRFNDRQNRAAKARAKVLMAFDEWQELQYFADLTSRAVQALTGAMKSASDNTIARDVQKKQEIAAAIDQKLEQKTRDLQAKAKRDKSKALDTDFMDIDCYGGSGSGGVGQKRRRSPPRSKFVDDEAAVGDGDDDDDDDEKVVNDQRDAKKRDYSDMRKHSVPCALVMRKDWWELIAMGVKTIELRSKPLSKGRLNKAIPVAVTEQKALVGWIVVSHCSHLNPAQFDETIGEHHDGSAYDEHSWHCAWHISSVLAFKSVVQLPWPQGPIGWRTVPDAVYALFLAQWAKDQSVAISS